MGGNQTRPAKGSTMTVQDIFDEPIHGGNPFLVLWFERRAEISRRKGVEAMLRYNQADAELMLKVMKWRDRK